MPTFEDAPRWRREPYRLFFALGLLHAWAGVSPWFLLAMGWIEADRRIYHSIAQIQGFLICFAVGFLFTMIPRRTKTEAPHAWQMIIGLICPVGATICGAFKEFSWSQMFWFLLVGVLASFLVPRIRRSAPSERALPGLVWVPIAFLMGLTGSLCFAARGILGPDYHYLHTYGKLFLLQGMFLGLVMGVGGLVFPLFTRGEAPPPPGSADRVKARLHLLAAAVLVGTFVAEVEGYLRSAYAARGALTLAVLLFAARIHHIPRLPGVNRLLVWGTAWLLPLGYALAALYPTPGQASAGLHIVFIGGFAAMAFAVGMHVSLAHGGRKHVAGAWPWQIVAYAVLFLASTVARTLMVFDPERYVFWMGTSSGLFLLGTTLWALLAVPSLLPSASLR